MNIKKWINQLSPDEKKILNKIKIIFNPLEPKECCFIPKFTLSINDINKIIIKAQTANYFSSTLHQNVMPIKITLIKDEFNKNKYKGIWICISKELLYYWKN